ncbi:DMP19 family protein [Thalassomonas viridans]|uniref:DMP19 family protein n=1 Tax=Thalassomonas viridans TaxID=137584 RepID=A0AAF0CAV3_9GAMM|nr:DMP19 family protein [Thalassomonas viridans]WDE06720.1 DMP19 family protein [Thalassomonas viridans]
MSEKVPCTECGVAVLPSTAERTGGLCMPCKNGTRKNIEQSKEYYKRERELDKTCPFRALWRGLVDKVYKQEGGFAALSEDEKLYYSVNALGGEVYNGGFVQYFDNSSGETYRYAELGLVRLGATSSLKLLRKAKEELLGSGSVPKDQAERWAAIKKHSDEPDLDGLDTEFYKDPDQLDKKLESFAVEVGLVKNA